MTYLIKIKERNQLLWELFYLMKLGLKETAYILKPYEFADEYKEAYGL